MTALGLAITLLTVSALTIEFFRHKKTRFPAYGWIGLAALLIAEWLMFRSFAPVAVYFTPIAWTCYILLVDAAVLSIKGHSRLHDRPSSLLALAFLSIPLWMIFEAYNLRLRNWTYVGLPQPWLLAGLGYGWSFATIFPGIFETADLIDSFGWFGRGIPWIISRSAEQACVLFGAICLILPLLLPSSAASYLFALVWIGFVFLLDPINHWLGLPSFIADFAQGRTSRFWSFFGSGFVCGWLWEFWNYWAAAKWHYVFPMLQRWKIFEMPVPGYLGFLPFALECFVMYVTATWILRLLKRKGGTEAYDP
jgi:hypothetical protein